MWQFRNVDGLEDFLLKNLGADHLLPGSTSDEAVYFMNGDKMTINLKTGEMIWEPIEPGSMATSRLSMKLHIWFGKGIIYPVNNEEES